MKPVVHEEITGCGIAAVAAAAGVPYRQAQQAAKSLGIFADDKELWSQTHHVRKLLKHFGIRTSSRETRFHDHGNHFQTLPYSSVKWHLEDGKPFWHWVLFVRENGRSYVLDSKKSLRQNIRTDFGRMKPKWSSYGHATA